jgi:hypothetical protein
MANLAIHINVSPTDSPLNTSGVDWVEFSEGNDQLIFSKGSPEVIDGGDTPTQQELISAGVVLAGSEIIVPEYFLLDQSANELKSVDLMGDTTGRYVMAFDFDDTTASEPVLEVWDDINLNTVTGAMLGAGTPSQSFVRGITTTASAPSASWTGSRLAGSTSGNFLYLNDQFGALTGATTLYCSLKVIVPASQTIGFSGEPVFVVKWLSN